MELESPAGLAASLPAPRSFLISRRATLRQITASTFGPSNRASALLRGPAAPAPVTFKRFILTKPCRALRPCALVIFGKGQRRAAASCLEPRGGFLGNLSCGGAGNLGQGQSQGQATGWAPLAGHT